MGHDVASQVAEVAAPPLRGWRAAFDHVSLALDGTHLGSGPSPEWRPSPVTPAWVTKLADDWADELEPAFRRRAWLLHRRARLRRRVR